MKYTFIAPLHFLKLNTTLSKGIQLKANMRISNNTDFIEKLMESTDIYEWIGAVGYHELKGSTYIYAEGDITDLIEVHGERDTLDFCFLLLREIYILLELLWEIKDHSSYVRDGFIYLHNPKDWKDGNIQKASLSKVSSTSDGKHETCIFTKDEIGQLKLLADQYDLVQFEHYIDGGKYNTTNTFNKELSRLERSKSFVSIARFNTILPLKIFNYCTALECLLTTDNTEVSHKIAERASLLLGTNYEEKKTYFQAIKKSYGIRSKLTHGQAISQGDEELISHSKILDGLLRQIYNQNHDAFSSYNNPELEQFFMKLMFKD